MFELLRIKAKIKSMPIAINSLIDSINEYEDEKRKLLKKRNELIIENNPRKKVYIFQIDHSVEECNENIERLEGIIQLYSKEFIEFLNYISLNCEECFKEEMDYYRSIMNSRRNNEKIVLFIKK